ncbi:Cdc6/Cdc18 family protein [Halorarum halobium]|uniref:Cdc6/Cdc18 family protein n=1 Tax=Halorarum halobium TaxID=3075121 RepID=UPI0028B12D5F|nr:AAA family ATPase [Halobaculum sp. XH14]
MGEDSKTELKQEDFGLFQDNNDSKIFADIDILDPDRIPGPDEFVERKEEMQTIASGLRHMINGNSGRNMMITGDTGLGKTMCARITVNELSRNMDEHQNFRHEYFNDLESERDTLQKLSRALELVPEKKTEPYQGTNLSFYYDLLVEKLKQEEIYLVITFDEVDRLMSNKKEGKPASHGNSMLKQLLEVRKKLKNSDAEAGLTLICITNDSSVPGDLSSKVKDRFGREGLHFSSYNALQLRNILEKRAEKAFQPGVVDSGAIFATASLVARDSASARRAIELLRKAGELADENGDGEIRKEDHVDPAHEALETNEILEAIKSLPKHNKITLYAIIANYSGGKLATGDVYENYKEICRKRADLSESEMLSQRSISEHIKKMDMQGIIQAKTVSKGRYGRTREITINFSESTRQDLMEHLHEENLYLAPDSMAAEPT